MKGEIDNDFYCSADAFIGNNDILEQCDLFVLLNIRKDCGFNDCTCYHRKYPTPEQYKKEYGEEYTSDRPVWVRLSDNKKDWRVMSYRHIKRCIEQNPYNYKEVLIVCACSPFGKPDKAWRPE